MIRHGPRWFLPANPSVAIKVGVLAAASLVSSAAAAVPVTLYDDFSSSSVSNALWLKDTSGAGTISFSGGQAILDMSSPTVGKAARLVFPTTVTMQGISSQFRATWDQQLIADNLNAFGSGFAILSGTTWLIEGEQVGRQNDGLYATPYYPHHFMLYGGTGTGTYGTVDGGTAKHHFDLYFNASTITLSIYSYNAAFDATPDSYLTSGTLLEELTTPTPAFSATAPLTLMLSNEKVSGPDLYAQTRAVVTFDNVFLSVPEPASIAILAAGAMLLGRRAHRQLRMAAPLNEREVGKRNRNGA